MLKKFLYCFHVKSGGATYTLINTVIISGIFFGKIKGIGPTIV